MHTRTPPLAQAHTHTYSMEKHTVSTRANTHQTHTHTFMDKLMDANRLWQDPTAAVKNTIMLMQAQRTASTKMYLYIYIHALH